jgi:hypothetical protein
MPVESNQFIVKNAEKITDCDYAHLKNNLQELGSLLQRYQSKGQEYAEATTKLGDRFVELQ